MSKQFISLFLLLFLCACSVDKPRTYDFPRPVDTSTLPIVSQELTHYYTEDKSISIDNDFPSARISDLAFHAGNDSVTIFIRPENKPINPSPWYAFRIISEVQDSLTITLDYGEARHRYLPKLSRDKENWVAIDTLDLMVGSEQQSATFTIDVPVGTLWVAGQELWPSAKVGEWANELAISPLVNKQVFGQSKLGRDLIFLDIHNGSPKKKPAIVLFSRQHPPEVTGFLALQSFMDELLNNELSASFFDRYRVLVYPLLNPDGVDMGHWRHNAGGIDLNRDWAYYRQPEVASVSNHVVALTAKDKNDIQLGMDFHSTWKDVYYTPDETVPLTKLADFRALWHARIERIVGSGFKVNNDPSPIGRPTSAGWFSTQFGVPGITYEVGDATPRDFIDQKARASAIAMVELLLAN